MILFLPQIRYAIPAKKERRSMPTVHMNFSVPSIRVDWYISYNDRKIKTTNDTIPIDITILEESI